MEYLTTDKEGIKILIEVLKEKGIRQVLSLIHILRFRR